MVRGTLSLATRKNLDQKRPLAPSGRSRLRRSRVSRRKRLASLAVKRRFAPYAGPKWLVDVAQPSQGSRTGGMRGRGGFAANEAVKPPNRHWWARCHLPRRNRTKDNLRPSSRRRCRRRRRTTCVLRGHTHFVRVTARGVQSMFVPFSYVNASVSLEPGRMDAPRAPRARPRGEGAGARICEAPERSDGASANLGG
jgi:hypothetical protein